MSVQPDPRRCIPRTDDLLARPEFVAAAARLGAATTKRAIGRAQAAARAGTLAPEDVAAAASTALTDRIERPTSLRPLLNATGIVLHTNVGRAPLSAAARAALDAAAGYVDVEFDVETGRRAHRGRGALAALRDAVPDAQDALVVNNGAAALVLATTALAVARGRPEVVVSRGEMVEIGAGFRLPDLIASTGARLREVGTTNRTSRRDYGAALTDRTGVVLKVHPSNFRIEGFTSAVPVAELAPLCAQAAVPLVADIGSGLLAPDPLLPDEPDAAGVLAAGADVVTASGDKLVGGPQAGLVLGRAEFVGALRSHPLARALRVDKLTLAALEATLRAGGTPTAAYLHAPADELRTRAEALAARAPAGVGATVVPTQGAVGGGSAPGLPLPGWAAALPEEYAAALCLGQPCVLARVEQGRCLVDLRCVPPEDDPAIADAIAAVAGGRADAGA